MMPTVSIASGIIDFAVDEVFSINALVRSDYLESGIRLPQLEAAAAAKGWVAPGLACTKGESER